MEYTLGTNHIYAASLTIVFSPKKNLVKHQWKHTDEKTYLSSQCDTFIWNQRMVEHQSIYIYIGRSHIHVMQPSDKYFGQQKNISVIGPNKVTLLLDNKNLNGKPVAMAEVFRSMSELNIMQHLSVF